MNDKTRAREVLLLSAAPDACAAYVNTLRRRGAVVRVAQRPARALALLRHEPPLVLVDLVHGPGLDDRVVRALNEAPRTVQVVVLHQGSLEGFRRQVDRLMVDGFYRLRGESARGSRPRRLK